MLAAKLHFRFAVFCSASLLLAASNAQARDCHKQSWAISVASPDSSVRWIVRKGGVCGSVDRPDRLRNGVVDSFSLVSRAGRGHVAVLNRLADRGFAYKAPGNYVGADEFKIGCMLRTRLTPEPVKCSISVKVTVVDKL